MDRGGGVSSLAPLTLSNLAAMDAVLNGRTVFCEFEEAFRVGERLRRGELGGSGVAVVPRVLSHEGGFGDAGLAAVGRRFTWDGVVGVVSLGFKGELFGVDGRRVDGEASLIEPGLRNGDWRGLLKESGEGL